MSEITLRQLEYFVAVADAGTVTAAAGTLHLSQSALSMALSDLERALDVQLLVRGRRGVHLTHAGEGVLSDSRRLIAGVADLHDSARDFQESMSGRLVVGCYGTLSPLLLPAVVDAFTRDHPKVDLSIVEGSHELLEAKLRSGVLDVALLYDYGRTYFASERALAAEPLVTSAPYVLLPPDHPLTARKAVMLQQLVDEPLILFDLSPGGEYFLSLFDEAGLKPSVRFRTTSYELVRALVARGLGYAILSQRTKVATSYEGLHYEVRELKGKHPGLTVHAVTLGDVPRTRRTQAFIAQCKRSWA